MSITDSLPDENQVSSNPPDDGGFFDENLRTVTEPGLEVGESGASNIEVEIVPDEQAPAPVSDADPDDDEIASYSKQVSARMKKLTSARHQERRQKEQAEGQAREALRYAQNVMAENQRYKAMLAQSENSLVDVARQRSEAQIESAGKSFRDAQEDGDPDQILTAQQALTKAHVEADRWASYQPIPVDVSDPGQQQQQYPLPQVDEKTAAWIGKNQWFNTNPTMQGQAVSLHKVAGARGFQLASDEYFDFIDQGMRHAFPDEFPAQRQNSGSPGRRVQPQQTNTNTSVRSVVAPAQRTAGATRRVQLTASQVEVAEKLGITPEQYAEQALKLESQNG